MDLVLPMTHDSATATLTASTLSKKDFGYTENSTNRLLLRAVIKLPFFNQLVRGIATTQYYNPDFITSQLIMGVRVFDLRLFINTTKAEEIKYQHGMVAWNTSVLNSLRAVYNNYVRNPQTVNEPFILRFSHLLGSQAKNITVISEFLTIVQNIFGTTLCPRAATDRSDFNLRPLSSFQTTPVIVVLDNNNPQLRAQFRWLHISSEMYDDDYSNVRACDVGMDVSDVMNYLRKSALLSVPAPKLKQLQLHLQMESPDFMDLISNPSRAINIQEATERPLINSQGSSNPMGLNSFLLSEIKKIYNSPGINILSFDFYTSDLTTQIIQINKLNGVTINEINAN